MTSCVLLADDDKSVRDALARALQLEGYDVTAVADGLEAIRAATTKPYDLVLLDVSMPKADGLEVCRTLRASGSNVPILMLTARTETSDRVAGLDAGADDYLAKPFDLDELYARMRALLRRAVPEAISGERFTVGDLTIETAGRRATRGENELELTRTEFDLLELFARNVGIVLDHATIYDRIWQYDFGPDSKNLAVYVGYLRRKTESEGASRLIHTVRGVGYVMRDD